MGENLGKIGILTIMWKPVKCKSDWEFLQWCFSDPWLAPYKYPSYPPPIPLWAAGKPRRRYIPYFGKDYTTSTPTPPTTTAGRPVSSSCQHLPSECWSSPSYLPLPLNCIGESPVSSLQSPVSSHSALYWCLLVSDICSLDSPSLLSPVLSTCSALSSGNLPLHCIQVIQVTASHQPRSQVTRSLSDGPQEAADTPDTEQTGETQVGRHPQTERQ